MPERPVSLISQLKETIGREPQPEDDDREWPGVEGGDRFVATDGNAGAQGPVTHVEIDGYRGGDFRVTLGATPDDDGVNISLSADNRKSPTDGSKIEIGSLGTFSAQDARKIASVLEACADYHDGVSE